MADYDPAKEAINLAKHGVSLARWIDLEVLAIVSPREGNETPCPGKLSNPPSMTIIRSGRRLRSSHEIPRRRAIEGFEVQHTRSGSGNTRSSEDADQNSGINPSQPGSREPFQKKGSGLAVPDRQCPAQDRQEGKLIERPVTPVATAPPQPVRTTRTADAVRTGAISVRDGI